MSTIHVACIKLQGHNQEFEKGLFSPKPTLDNNKNWCTVGIILDVYYRKIQSVIVNTINLLSCFVFKIKYLQHIPT